MSVWTRVTVVMFAGLLAACAAEAPDEGGGGEALPDAGDQGEDDVPDEADAGPTPVVLCQGVASSLGLVGSVDTTFGFYRDGAVNDIYRFGGKSGDDLLDVMIVQNKPPYDDGSVEPVEFELKTTDDFTAKGIWVQIYPDVDYDGNLDDLTGVGPTFAAVRARINITDITTSSAVATVENASFVEVDAFMEPIEGGCTTEVASFSVNVPVFTP